MTAADLSEMPVSEKLKLMEALWDSLCTQPTDTATVPDWHGEVLETRQRRLADGEETVSDWKDAKERIRTHVKAC